VAIHGLNDEFLRDKPVFQAVGLLLLDFLADSRLVIHNAAFDLKFLNAELTRASLPALSPDRATDTLLMARKRFPGSPATLDALCRRFGVDNAQREKHGALLDSELLAEVYLELVGGRQPTLVLAGKPHHQTQQAAPPEWCPGPRPNRLPPRLTDAEAMAHADFIAALGEASIWRTRG
jgi:DNA polymerase-3 subunit epsilon